VPSSVPTRGPIRRRASGLDVLAEDQGRAARRHGAGTGAVATVKVDELEVEGVDVAGEDPVEKQNVSEDGVEDEMVTGRSCSEGEFEGSGLTPIA